MSREYDSNQSVRVLIRLMKALGLWDFGNNPWNIWYRIYGWILHFVCTFTFIALMYINAGFSNNAESLSKSLYISLTETSLVVKVLNVIFLSKRIITILHQYETLVEGFPLNEAERNMENKSSTFFCRLRNVEFTMTCCYLVTSFIITVYKKTYILPHPIWLPFDYHNPEYFYYVYCYYLISMCVTAFTNCTIDTVQSYLLLKIAIYYKLLGNRLENIAQCRTNVDAELLKQIRFHGKIKKLTKECEFIVSIPVFTQIVISAFVICFSMYLLQRLSFLEQTLDFFLFSVFAFVMTLQIFLPCKFGNDITTSAAYINTCIYSGNWVGLSLKTQRLIFIYMEHLKSPTIVRAGKFFKIGYDVFVQVMNTAYRLYAVMVNIDN